MNYFFTDDFQWFKTQKVKKPIRIMPPPTPVKSGGNGTTSTQSSYSEKLGDLKVCILGVPSKTMVLFVYFISDMFFFSHKNFKST